MLRNFASALLLAATPTLFACVGVGPEGVPVRFAGQKNIVVWDKAHGVEHFVRDAQFETDASNLGFIAPTPTRPTIESVDGQAFSVLNALRPYTVRARQIDPVLANAAPRAGVEVVEKRLVGGYEATVLKASNPLELKAWLKANGYGVPKFVQTWSTPYIVKGWYFTAFKVATGRGRAETGPIRMSFRTDMPYNPYSVPAENGGASGLSLYYVSVGNEVPKIGGLQAWATPQWSASLNTDAREMLATDLKLGYDSVPANSRVRFYKDPNFGRAGYNDLFFVDEPKRVSDVGFGGIMAGIGLGVFAFARPGRRYR